MNLCRGTVTQAHSLGHCRRISHTNWRLSQLHQQKLIPESLCETALPGDVMQPGKHPMVLLISASYHSLPVGVFYNHTSARLLSWFLLEICWGDKALLPWGVNLFTWLSSQVRSRIKSSFHGSTWHGELSPVLKAALVLQYCALDKQEIHLNGLITRLNSVSLRIAQFLVVIDLFVSLYMNRISPRLCYGLLAV